MPLLPLSLFLIALGVAGWWWGRRWTAPQYEWSGAVSLVRADFGFNWLARQVAVAVRWLAAQCSRLQTGQLNWNVVGIVGGLLVVVLLLVYGVGQ